MDIEKLGTNTLYALFYYQGSPGPNDRTPEEEWEYEYLSKKMGDFTEKDKERFITLSNKTSYHPKRSSTLCG